MSTLMEELTAIKAVEDKLTANKVANFAYTDHAYDNPLTEADGVETYNVNNEQNIPIANASILKVNTTILTKGWRAQASAITRMLMNHFLGRCSYNLNKVNDLFSLLLTKFMAFLGSPNGIATLDANGRIPYSQLPESAVELKGYWNADTNTPSLADGTGTNGDEYIVEVAGTQDLGSGSQYFNVGDRVLYTGGVWKNITSGFVRTINALAPNAQGNVHIDMDNGNIWNRKWLCRVFSGALGNKWRRCENTQSLYGYFNGGDICLAYNNGIYLYYASTSDESNSSLLKSTDGLNWEVSLSGISRVRKGALQYYDGVWYIATLEGLWKSEDNAITWTKISELQCQGGFFYWEAKSIYLLAVIDGYYWSEDLETWTKAYATGVSYNTRFVASNDLCVACPASVTARYTTDGKTWYQYSTDSSAHTPRGYAFYINEMWFGSDFNGKLCYSVNGTSWTPTNINLAVSIVVHYNGLFYATGISSTSTAKGIWVSLDGVTWRNDTVSAQANGERSLAVYNGCIIAGTWDGSTSKSAYVLISRDCGASWLLVPNPVSSSPEIYDVFYFNGVLFIVMKEQYLYCCRIEDVLEGYFTD